MSSPRVLIIGDSIMEDVAAAVIAGLKADGETRARFIFGPVVPRSGAGYFLLRAELNQRPPDVVVAELGRWELDRNDFSPTDPEWRRQYEQILEDWVNVLAAHDTTVLLVGAPTTEDAAKAASLSIINSLYRDIADRREDVDYLDSDPVLTVDGRWTLTLPSPRSGRPERIRSADRDHLCPAGVIRLATPILGWLSDQLDVRVDPDWQDGSWRTPTEPVQVWRRCPAL